MKPRLIARIWDTACSPNALPRFVKKENLGFSRACNLGAEHAKGQYLFFLNNDTILTPNWLNPLLQALHDDPRLGMVGPLLLYPGTGRVQHLGVVFFPETKLGHLYEHFPADHPLVAKKRRFQAITGAAMLMRRDLFKQCDGFFPGFVNGFEDVDLCVRVAQKGYSMTCIPESVVFHLAGQTEGRSTHEIDNGRVLYARCAALLFPDIHRVIAEDGYELRLTPWLMPYVALPDTQRRRINNELSLLRDDVDVVRENLRIEPLWEEGYATLATHLEQNGAWEEACLVRFFHVRFVPSLNATRQLFLAAKKARNPQLMKNAAQQMRAIEMLLHDMAGLRSKAAGIYTKAREDGDENLKRICRNWLTDNNQA